MNSDLKKKIRRIRNFLIGLGLISILSTKGRAIVYDWLRMRQRRTDEQEKKRKQIKERIDKLAGKNEKREK